MISQLAKSVRETLKIALPNTLIKEEEYVTDGRYRFFFDFYIPSLRLFIEVQGVQHEKDHFVGYFHNDAASYRASLRRDLAKRVWCYENEKFLVIVYHDEIPLDPLELLGRIKEAQDSEIHLSDSRKRKHG